MLNTSQPLPSHFIPKCAGLRTYVGSNPQTHALESGLPVICGSMDLPKNITPPRNLCWLTHKLQFQLPEDSSAKPLAPQHLSNSRVSAPPHGASTHLMKIRFESLNCLVLLPHGVSGTCTAFGKLFLNIVLTKKLFLSQFWQKTRILKKHKMKNLKSNRTDES